MYIDWPAVLISNNISLGRALHCDKARWSFENMRVYRVFSNDRSECFITV